MLFGGIFKIWFGGKSRARRIGIIKLQSQDDDRLDDNAPGTDLGGDGTDSGTNGDGGSNVNKLIAGRLAFDRNDDGSIDVSSETSFKNDQAGATTDFEGLESYDANQDGLIDVNDPQFQKFGVWNDKNNDGRFDPGEFQTLAALGIESIDVGSGLSNGALNFTRTDGTTGRIALTQSLTFS